MLAVRYILAIAMIVLGTLAIFGVLEARFADPQSGERLRMMFGLVLILFGVYRVASLESGRRRRRRERHITGEA